MIDKVKFSLMLYTRKNNKSLLDDLINSSVEGYQSMNVLIAFQASSECTEEL